MYAFITNKICAGVEMYASDYRNLIGECSNRVEYTYQNVQVPV